jgi:Fe-S cluster assembly protein SufD
MTTIENIKERFEQLQSQNKNGLGTIRRNAFEDFNSMGIPTVKHEEWKYTRISKVFNNEFNLPLIANELSPEDLNAIRLPGYEEANELFFINGIFSFGQSVIRSDELNVIALEEASKDYKEIISQHFGHSSNYFKIWKKSIEYAINPGTFVYKCKKSK